MTRARRLRSRLALSAALVAGVAALSGCGTGGVDRSSNTSGGRDLFIKNCGTCHTLADAGTTGTIGPDLDSAFGPSRAQGFSESTIRQIVRDQIHLPSPPADQKPCPGPPKPNERCFPTMPANIVTGSDADAVAAYVASVAGTGAAPPPATTVAPPPPPPPAPSGGAAAKGRSLYDSLGCKSCHSLDGSKGIGPTFKGLFGSQVKLTNGQTVTADAAYLLESIEDPDKQIVQGFPPGIMSATIKPHSVAMADAQALVAFIKTQK